MKQIFCMQISMKVFYKLTLGKASQNKKFAIYLQYLKENVKNEDDFLPCR